jgi:hypothetical protein
MHGAGGAPLCTCSSSVPTDSLATSSLVAYYVLARTLFFSFLFGRKMMYITWHLKIRELYKTKRDRERGTSLSAVSAVQNKKTNASCTKQNASTVSAENLKYSSVTKLLLSLSFLFIFDHSSYLKYLF